MYEALKLFHTHVQQTTALLLGVMTAVFIVFGFTGSDNGAAPDLAARFVSLGGVILLLVFPVALISCSIIGRYYRLYVSALYYAGRLEHAAAPLIKHPWFVPVPDDPALQDVWIRNRTYGWGHSWFMYSLILGLIGIVGLIGGGVILIRYF
jgi:hypothetical protein